MRIGIDAMGGDHAPDEEVKGALMACESLADDDKIVLIGRQDEIQARLSGKADWQRHIEIVHAEQVIHMNETPVEALRTKPDSSIAMMAQMHCEGRLDACISAGNTGACVAAAQMRLRRLPNVHRPGIAILTPTFHGPVALCDVGANVDCRPQHLHQYAVMASIYLKTVAGIDNPRVGLLSVGEEEAKGNELVKRTRELIAGDAGVNFIGNVEGRDLFRGVCDVMVCDGFVGNVVLKLIEGMAVSVVEALLKELAAAQPAQAGAFKKAGKDLMSKYDYNEYGGAPLLGVAGISIICHGASTGRGIMNAVRVAKEFASHQVNERIMDLLSNGQRSIDA
jgi:glycerol-3-phosphate acyltransferase PlsX